MNEKCVLLDRARPIREALVHSILISVVKDIRSDVLWSLKASHFAKNFKPCLQALFKEFSRNKNCIDLECLSRTFPYIGIDIIFLHLKIVSNIICLFITYPLLLIVLLKGPS